MPGKQVFAVIAEMNISSVLTLREKKKTTENKLRTFDKWRILPTSTCSAYGFKSSGPAPCFDFRTRINRIMDSAEKKYCQKCPGSACYEIVHQNILNGKVL